MSASSFVRCALVFALLVSRAARFCIAQSTSGPPLSLDDVVNDWKNGIAEDLIITKIRKNARAFNLSSAEMRELTNSGIPTNVVKYLLDPSQPYTTPTPPPPVAPPAVGPAAVAPPEVRTPPRTYPADAHADRVPVDPGLYRFADNTPLKTEVKLLLGENQGAGLTKV